MPVDPTFDLAKRSLLFLFSTCTSLYHVQFPQRLCDCSKIGDELGTAEPRKLFSSAACSALALPPWPQISPLLSADFV